MSSTLRRMIAPACATLICFASLAPADIITIDTYIDSYDGTPSPFIPTNQDVNYGGSAATKVVTSPGSTQYPNATSAVRSLIKLPDSFWTTVGTSNVAAADVTLRIRNLNGNTGIPFTRTVSAHPMLRSFVTGNGFQPTVPGGTVPNTQGGTQNTAANPIGADWLTYDGVNPWSGGGAGTDPSYDYDAAHSVIGVLNTVGVTTMSWDLTALINDPGTRQNIHDFGLMLKITDDLNFPAVGTPQQFISYYSYEGALTQGDPTAYYPVTTVTVPEPATLAGIGLMVALGARRRRA